MEVIHDFPAQARCARKNFNIIKLCNLRDQFGQEENTRARSVSGFQNLA
jgi:hypothetical protein